MIPMGVVQKNIITPLQVIHIISTAEMSFFFQTRIDHQSLSIGHFNFQGIKCEVTDF